MSTTAYYLETDDPKYPGVARFGPNGIEYYSPASPRKWEIDPLINSLSQEEFSMNFRPISEQDARKYMAIIDRNVAIMLKNKKASR